MVVLMVVQVVVLGGGVPCDNRQWVLTKPISLYYLRGRKLTETDKNPEKAAIIIKKYANRRLYNTASSAYVTHENLCQMVKDGIDFVVYDARSNEDITRSVLTQIIVDEESKGQNLLPVSFLRQLISFYGDSMQWLVPGYLESTMKSFTHNQDKVRLYLTEAFGGLFSFNSFESMTKQNMAMVENAMKLFTPGLDKFTAFDPSMLNPMAHQLAEMAQHANTSTVPGTVPGQNTTMPQSGVAQNIAGNGQPPPNLQVDGNPSDLSATNLQHLQTQLAHLQRQLDLMLQAKSDANTEKST